MNTIAMHPSKKSPVAFRSNVYDKSDNNGDAFAVLKIESGGMEFGLFLHPEEADELDKLVEVASAMRDALRMRDPNYVPTVEEATSEPSGFVAGMTEIGGEG